jgi:hypothetical protein
VVVCKVSPVAGSSLTRDEAHEDMYAVAGMEKVKKISMITI